MSVNSEKYRYLAKNLGLLTLSSFAAKLLSFLLVPLYTNVLTTTEYGINDLFLTTIGILIPIVTLNIQESVMRFSLDKNYSRKSIISVGIKYLIYGSVFVIAALVINYVFSFHDLFRIYAVYFFLMFLSQALSGIITAYIRGIEKIADLSISGVISSLFIITCNILFLVVFRWGLIGYFRANIIGPFVQCAFLIIRGNVFKDTRKKYICPSVEKEMILYSKPLILNSIGWWINNAADKYVIIYFLGMAENGIYAVAGKIPSVLNIFQTIFAQAWTISAVKDFDPEDKNGFFSKTYAAYNCFMTIGCSAIIMTDKLLARILYSKDFYYAWRYVPWLTGAVLFGALAGYLGGLFSAAKRPEIFAQSTLIGSVINITLNFSLTPVIGAIGAAAATGAGYMAVWLVRLVQSRRFIRLKINLKRDVISYCILLLQTVIHYYFSGIVLIGLEFVLFDLIAVMYYKDLLFVFFRIKEKFLHKD